MQQVRVAQPALSHPVQQQVRLPARVSPPPAADTLSAPCHARANPSSRTIATFVIRRVMTFLKSAGTGAPEPNLPKFRAMGNLF
jgi:hypothetical protein